MPKPWKTILRRVMYAPSAIDYYSVWSEHNLNQFFQISDSVLWAEKVWPFAEKPTPWPGYYKAEHSRMIIFLVIFGINTITLYHIYTCIFSKNDMSHLDLDIGLKPFSIFNPYQRK